MLCRDSDLWDTCESMIVKTISLLGHKDHGKSTLIGSLLMHTGSATQVRIKEAEAYSKKLHKDFEPAFILDSFAEEREQEMTYDTTRAEIKYKDLAFAFIDVPGHEELIKNMISGASYGEIAVLLVSAKADEGIRDQTKRHLFIARMLGIESLVVAVNKMDLVGYDKKRFDMIKDGLSGFIEKIGFEKTMVSFVPVSAYKGENLVKRSRFMNWYKGKTLIDLIYSGTKKQSGNKTGALRIIVQGFLEGQRDFAVGRVVKGNLSLTGGFCISPGNLPVKIKSIIVKGKKVKKAIIGENVALQFDKKMGSDLRGSVISNKGDCPEARAKVRATIFITKKLDKNSSIRFNGSDIQIKKMSVAEYIDPTTGTRSTNGKMELLSAISADLILSKQIPAEKFDETRELGRFVLYSDGAFAGIGTITGY